MSSTGEFTDLEPRIVKINTPGNRTRKLVGNMALNFSQGTKYDIRRRKTKD
jgi:hypothetical protein